MTRSANIAFFALTLVVAAPLTAGADSQPSPGGAQRVHGVMVPPRAEGQTAKVCTGPSVTVTVTDPSTGRKEKRCKCAPGAVGIATKNVKTGAEALRCLRQAGPRP